jgi:glucose/arabinose dehydrogenase
MLIARSRVLDRLFGAGLVAGLLLLAAPPASAQIEDPFPAPIRDSGFKVSLETLASGLTAPNWGTSAPGVPGRLFVVDQDGTLWDVALASGDKRVFLDVSDRLVALGVAGPGTFDERGFLGLAFHPDYADNGLLYTYTSEPVAAPADFSTLPAGTDPNHQSVIVEWQVPEPTNPEAVVDPTTARELLRIDEPQFNHNAGALVFGPNGNLFIALGDGGGADDQGVGHSPQGNGQDPGNPLGTILRIDPGGANSANGQYGIPMDNPFVGVPDMLDEIFAFGFRNPFRISFDRATADLYAADVGQNDVEEVDIVVAGGNYGWNHREGRHCYEPAAGCRREGLIDPIYAYDHGEGRSITGGHVYTGDRIPALVGKYLFADFVSGRIWALALPAPGVIATERNVPVATLGKWPLLISTFARDGAGETVWGTDGPRAVLETNTDGDHVIGLTVSGNDRSNTREVTVTVDSSRPAPAGIRFDPDIKSVLQDDGGPNCDSCHAGEGAPGAVAGVPVYYTDDQPEQRALYDEVIARVNFKEPADSALLRKPAGYHHYGGCLEGFDLTDEAGDCAGAGGDRSHYDLFLNWILHGAPR